VQNFYNGAKTVYAGTIVVFARGTKVWRRLCKKKELHLRNEKMSQSHSIFVFHETGDVHQKLEILEENVESSINTRMHI
jgi:hypothetical protein